MRHLMKRRSSRTVDMTIQMIFTILPVLSLLITVLVIM